MEDHAQVVCPHCWQTFEIHVDLTISGSQEFVYDCEVCCNPLEIACDVMDGALQNAEARSLEQ